MSPASEIAPFGETNDRPRKNLAVPAGLGSHYLPRIQQFQTIAKCPFSDSRISGPHRIKTENSVSET